jgi:hypothetical protein
MKFSILILLAFSVSCGRYDVTSGQSASIGEIKSLTVRSISASEQNTLSQMCSALSTKTATISSATGSTFTFGTSQTDCQGQSVGSGDVATYIQNLGSSFVFKRRSDNSDFFFSNVETTSSGVLSEICSNLGSLSGGFTTGQEVTYFKTTDILSADCPPASGEVCIYTEKGTDQGNNTAKIHTKEWIRVRLNSNQGKVGFFTYRRKVSQSYCGQNQVQIQSATLK